MTHDPNNTDLESCEDEDETSPGDDNDGASSHEGPARTVYDIKNRTAAFRPKKTDRDDPSTGDES